MSEYNLEEKVIDRYLARVQVMPSSQRSTTEQLEILQAVANRLGLYDAADWLSRQLHVGR